MMVITSYSHDSFPGMHCHRVQEGFNKKALLRFFKMGNPANRCLHLVYYGKRDWEIWENFKVLKISLRFYFKLRHSIRCLFQAEDQCF